MPKILPAPIFDPAKPEDLELFKLITPQPIVGFADGGSVSVGPGGRSLAQIKAAGTYLSEAERLWYLNQLRSSGVSIGDEASAWADQKTNAFVDELVNKVNLFSENVNIANKALMNPAMQEYQTSQMEDMEVAAQNQFRPILPEPEPYKQYTEPIGPSAPNQRRVDILEKRGVDAQVGAPMKSELDLQSLYEPQVVNQRTGQPVVYGPTPDFADIDTGTRAEGTLLDQLRQEEAGGQRDRTNALPNAIINTAVRKDPILDEVVKPLVGEAAKLTTRGMPAAAIIDTLVQAIGGGRPIETAAEKTAEFLTPTTYGEVALAAVPGIGDVQDVVDIVRLINGLRLATTATATGARRGVDSMLDALSVASAVGDAPYASALGGFSGRLDRSLKLLQRAADGTATKEDYLTMLDDILPDGVTAKHQNMGISALQKEITKYVDSELGKLPELGGKTSADIIGEARREIDEAVTDGYGKAPPPEAPLPSDLAGAAPRYGSDKLSFDSQLDLAAYIIRDSGTRSKQDAAYLAYVKRVLNTDEAGARAYGESVKRAVQGTPATAGVRTVASTRQTFAPETEGLLDDLVEEAAVAKPPVKKKRPVEEPPPPPAADETPLSEQLWDDFDPESMTKAKANSIIKKLTAAGYDVSDLESDLDEALSLSRADFDDAEEFADAKFAQWEQFSDTLMGLEPPEAALTPPPTRPASATMPDGSTTTASGIEFAKPPKKPAAKPKAKPAAPADGIDATVRAEAERVVKLVDDNPGKTPKGTALSDLVRVLDSLPGGRTVNPNSGKSPRSRAAIVQQIKDRLAGKLPEPSADPRAPGAVRTTRRGEPASPPDANAGADVSASREAMEEAQSEDLLAELAALTKETPDEALSILDDELALPDGVALQPEPPVTPKPNINPSVVNTLNNIHSSPVRGAMGTRRPAEVKAQFSNLMGLARTWAPDLVEDLRSAHKMWQDATDGLLKGKAKTDALSDANAIFEQTLSTAHRNLAEALGQVYETGKMLDVPSAATPAQSVPSPGAAVNPPPGTVPTPKKPAGAKAAPKSATPKGTAKAPPKGKGKGKKAATTPAAQAQPLPQPLVNTSGQPPSPWQRPAAGGATTPPPPQTPPPPPGATGAVPSPNGGGGKIPPQRIGNRIVAALRPLRPVTNEVVDIDNPVIKFFVGRSGINPSILADTDIGKLMVGYARQRISARELTNTAISYLDAIGDPVKIFKIRPDGFIPTINGYWGDVFSNPLKYRHLLNEKQRRYVVDYIRVVKEAENMRRAEGLRPRNLKGANQFGWFYIPRDVEAIRKGVLTRPSNPAAQRIYDTMAAGIKNGIEYNRDPKQTLYAHLHSAYNEVLHEQLVTELEPISFKTSDLIPTPIKTNYDASLKEKLYWRDQVRQLRYNRNVVKGGPNTAKVRNLTSQLNLAEVAYQNARNNHTSARSAYLSAKARLSGPEISVPGSRLGNFVTGNSVTLKNWRNRYYRPEDVDTLKKNIEQFETVDGFARAVETTGDMVRFLSATLDFGVGMIQGLPLLFRNPVAWGDSMRMSMAGFLDTRTQSRFIRNHMQTFQEMAQYGVPTGDIEVFRAIQAGRPITHNLRSVPGVRAFQSQYDTFLAVGRAHLWEGMKRYDPTSRAQLIKNMTGGLDSAALGTGARQRAFESTWMAFSPRFFRSTVGLIAQASRLDTPAGRDAAAQLMLMSTGAMMMTYGAGSVLMDKSLSEMLDSRTGTLNPLSGKEFLSVKVGDSWVGFGGQFRAIAQFVAKSVTADVSSFTSADLYDNPLLAFLVSRGAPAANLLGGAAEALTGIDTAPYKEINGLSDLGEHILHSSLPFAIQGLMEGEDGRLTLKNALANLGDAERMKVFGTELAGFRSSPETLYEKRDEIIPDAVSMAMEAGMFPPEMAPVFEAAETWSDLTPRERQTLEPFYAQLNPTLLDQLETESLTRGSLTAQKRKEYDDFWENPDTVRTMDTLWAVLTQGTGDGSYENTRAALDALQRLRAEASHIYSLDTEYQEYVASFPANDFQTLMNTYHGAVDRYTVGGQTNWELVDKEQSIIQETVANSDPTVGARLSFNTGYAAPNPNDHVLLQYYASARPVVDEYYSQPKDAREDYRREHPDVDFTLWFWGYTSTLLTDEAIQQAQNTVTGRQIKRP